MSSRTQPEAVTVADPMIGATVDGKYQIVRMIGRGGVGIVYLARRRNDQREVVIKILAPNWLGNSEILARFDREVARLSGLQHPNIVTLFDFGHHDGRAYMAMEYIKGESLKAYLDRKGRLALDEFVPIASQVLKGMGYAHSRGLMHRDLNPTNIMLCEREGRANFVKILDFGLAKLKEGEVKVTEQHDLIGTAGFLAPEQIKGEEVDLRVDVYALGVMFYRMLSGRMPFEGEHNATLLYKHVHEKPTPLIELLPADHGVPAHLLRLIEDCLEKSPSQRPADADEIVEDLIDCVPSALFSLPRIGRAEVAGATMVGLGLGAPARRPRSAAASAPGGPIAPLTVDDDPAEEQAGSTVAEIEDSPSSGTADAPTLRSRAALLEQGLDASTSNFKPPRSFTPTPTPPAHEQAPAPMSAPRRSGAVFVVAALAIVAGAAAAYVIVTRPPEPTVAPQVLALAEIRAILDRAEAAIDSKDYETATRELDRVKSFVGAHPPEQSRFDRVSERLVVGRLLMTAEKLESEGNLGAAIAAYKDVLARDATNEEAREALARHSDASTVKEASGSVGSVVMVSTPPADLYIDGSSAGTTPFTGQLTVGVHSIRMVLEGYQPWEASVEVLAEKNVPIQVSLRALPRSGRPARQVDAQPVKPPPSSAPETKPEPAPEPKPEPKPDDGIFMPTNKKGKDGGIFLPIGDSA
jgi:serine/threonine protein kinase